MQTLCNTLLDRYLSKLSESEEEDVNPEDQIDDSPFFNKLEKKVRSWRLESFGVSKAMNTTRNRL